MVEITFAIIAVALAIWAMVAVSNSQMSREKKIGWFAVVVFFPVLGPVLYYILGK